MLSNDIEFSGERKRVRCNEVLCRSKETCAASCTTSRVEGVAHGFVVAGSPRLRARCCAARTRPTSLSSLLAFRSFGIGAPSGSWWLGRASLRPEVPGRTAASGPHEIARGQVLPLRVGSHRARIIQFKSGPGPGSHRLPFPCAFKSSPYGASQLVEGLRQRCLTTRCSGLACARR